MEQWFRVDLGTGAAVFQQLRDLRELRYRHDPDVTSERIYIVVTDTDTSETFAYLPPGNTVLARNCGAQSCDPLDLDAKRFTVLSYEDFPIVPAF